MKTQRVFLIVAILSIAQPAWCRVLIRWTEPAVAPARSLGVSELVIPWPANPSSLTKTARKQGYRVYPEVDPGQAKRAAEASLQDGLAGLIVKAPGAAPLSASARDAKERSELESLVKSLRTDYSRLSVRLMWPGGKPPQMRGTMVVARNGVLQVSSPTQQPWIDSNVALIRFERTYDPAETPLVEFAWQLTDSLAQKYGPPPEDYELAVAEAGAFHADLILPIDKRLQDGLAQGKPEAFKTWREIQRYLEFAAAPNGNARVTVMSNVGVVTNNYDASYEATNLMARHNIAYRVIRPADLKRDRLDGADLIVVFSPLNSVSAQVVTRYAASGRTAVLVGQEGNFPWRSARVLRKSADATEYAVGNGRVVEIAAPIIDPEPFAQDVWRLLPEAERELSLWNGLTILAAAYQSSSAPSVDVELVNYSLKSLRAQIRIKGSFSQIRYETPEDGCCVSLAPTPENDFTEFVVPKLRIGGRAFLR